MWGRSFIKMQQLTDTVDTVSQCEIIQTFTSESATACDVYAGRIVTTHTGPFTIVRQTFVFVCK